MLALAIADLTYIHILLYSGFLQGGNWHANSHLLIKVSFLRDHADDDAKINSSLQAWICPPPTNLQRDDYYYVDEYEYVYEDEAADSGYYYVYEDAYGDEADDVEKVDRAQAIQKETVISTELRTEPTAPGPPPPPAAKKKVPKVANPDLYYGYDMGEKEEDIVTPLPPTVEIKKRKAVSIKSSIINTVYIQEVARTNFKCLPRGESQELWSLRHNNTMQASDNAKQRQQQKLTATSLQEVAKPKPAPVFRIPLGADCETLSCGSCRVIVEEFSKSLHPINVTDRMAYTSDSDSLKKFCQSAAFRLKYSLMAEGICMDFANENLGYGNAMLTELEIDLDKNLTKPAVIDKQKKVCAAVGACTAADFEVILTPQGREQEHWDEKCFVCQAFAKELEIRAHLSKDVMSDDRAVQTVKDICPTLNLPPGLLNDTCWSFIAIPSVLEDIAWIGKLHGEVVKNEGKGDIRFSDKMCQEMKYCTKWIDPEELQRQKMIEEMPVVFF